MKFESRSVTYHRLNLENRLDQPTVSRISPVTHRARPLPHGTSSRGGADSCSAASSFRDKSSKRVNSDFPVMRPYRKFDPVASRLSPDQAALTLLRPEKAAKKAPITAERKSKIPGRGILTAIPLGAKIILFFRQKERRRLLSESRSGCSSAV